MLTFLEVQHDKGIFSPTLSQIKSQTVYCERNFEQNFDKTTENKNAYPLTPV